MSDINLILAENPNFNFVGVEFNQTKGKTYYYKTLEQFEDGDKAIVDSPRDGLVVVTVVEANAECLLDTEYNYKWIVQKVDLTKYNEAIELETNIKKMPNSMRINKLKDELKSHLSEQIGSENVELLVNQVKTVEDK